MRLDTAARLLLQTTISTCRPRQDHHTFNHHVVRAVPMSIAVVVVVVQLAVTRGSILILQTAGVEIFPARFTTAQVAVSRGGGH
jgi:hypothetical protein